LAIPASTSGGSLKFLIDNARMRDAGSACDAACFANDPNPDLQEGLGELEFCLRSTSTDFGGGRSSHQVFGMLATARDRPAARDAVGSRASSPRRRSNNGTVPRRMTIFLDAESPIQVETWGPTIDSTRFFPRVGKAAQHRLKLGPVHTSAACISVNIICH
jgi:hypothetical protein